MSLAKSDEIQKLTNDFYKLPIERLQALVADDPSIPTPMFWKGLDIRAITLNLTAPATEVNGTLSTVTLVSGKSNTIAGAGSTVMGTDDINIHKRTLLIDYYEADNNDLEDEDQDAKQEEKHPTSKSSPITAAMETLMAKFGSEKDTKEQKKELQKKRKREQKERKRNARKEKRRLERIERQRLLTEAGMDTIEQGVGLRLSELLHSNDRIRVCDANNDMYEGVIDLVSDGVCSLSCGHCRNLTHESPSNALSNDTSSAGVSSTASSTSGRSGTVLLRQPLPITQVQKLQRVKGQVFVHCVSTRKKPCTYNIMQYNIIYSIYV